MSYSKAKKYADVGYEEEFVGHFDKIKISIASPEQVLKWSYGEIKKPETINYRTFKPERDGLFCAKIFGPVRDYECMCGKYKRMKYKGIICEKCGVEVTLAKIRRERMGHIELAAPVAHIWFTKSLPSRIGLVLDMTLKDLEKVLHFEEYIVLEPGLTHLKMRELLTTKAYEEAVEMYGEDSFSVGIGAEALHALMQAMDLEKEAERLRIEHDESASEIRKKRVLKIIRLIEAFMKSGTRPEWMILHRIPVIPPDLRPLVPLDGGRFASSDLNDLYRRVIHRNNRLKRLLELRAPDIIVRNEKRMLQEAVDSLFDNGRRSRPVTGANKRPFKSLSDAIKGKHGRFRQNLLGKRVDYSGRSVIVVGPNLGLHQCGLPKKMALELFKPFIYSRLEKYGMATTIKASKRIVEKERSEVWDILEEVIADHPVLLNRAPTLHRLGIQAFEPVLVEGKAIQLHPLVCTAFNADFDGDQMAVHVPLSIEAQLEARILMMATNNLLSPASGKPIITPSKDMVLGVYYLTIERANQKGEGMILSAVPEIESALFHKKLSLHAKIYSSIIDADGKRKRVHTTPGRMIFFNIMPKLIPFEMINKVLTSKDLSAITEIVYKNCGQDESVAFVTSVMRLGFQYATISGASFGKDDLIIPEKKHKLIEEAQKAIDKLDQQYIDGFIVDRERRNKILSIWSNCTENVSNAVVEVMSKDDPTKEINPVYCMYHSGARGSRSQVNQINGMRGLMANTSGQIVETPIKSNFKEGLQVLEYFTSTHGMRKGLADVALRTADAGYLTRRLVDVAQDCTVIEHDCGTKEGIVMHDYLESADKLASRSERIVGRILACDVANPKTGEIILQRNSMISEKHLPLLVDYDEIHVRSPLLCETHDGICAMCYGQDMARGGLISIGEAVGVVAAQSVGEPGTQLTMRGFHTGGAAQHGSEQSFVEAHIDGRVEISNTVIAVNSNGYSIVMGRHAELGIFDAFGKQRVRQRLPYGAKIYVKSGDIVEKGRKLAEWDVFNILVISERNGKVRYDDLVEDASIRTVVDEATGLTTKVVLDWKRFARAADLQPCVAVISDDGNNAGDAKYFVMPDTVIDKDNGVVVKTGDTIARIPKESLKNKDITGGLQRVSELLEVRIPRSGAVLAPFDGVVSFQKDYKNKRRFIIRSHTGEEFDCVVAKNRHVIVQDGDTIEKGEIVVDGPSVIQDMLKVLGVAPTADYLIREIQYVYRLQGIKIDDKHFEVVIRRMMQRVAITSPGDSNLTVGEQIDRKDLNNLNKIILQKGGEPAIGYPVIHGLTKSAVQTRSFISAASFQETTKVLSEAAIYGKIDDLSGLKENIMVGRRIPAGTGNIMEKMLRVAISRTSKGLLTRE